MRGGLAVAGNKEHDEWLAMTAALEEWADEWTTITDPLLQAGLVECASPPAETVVYVYELERAA